MKEQLSILFLMPKERFQRKKLLIDSNSFNLLAKLCCRWDRNLPFTISASSMRKKKSVNLKKRVQIHWSRWEKTGVLRCQGYFLIYCLPLIATSLLWCHLNRVHFIIFWGPYYFEPSRNASWSFSRNPNKATCVILWMLVFPTMMLWTTLAVLI